MKNEILKHAFIDAVLTALYVIAIASFLFNTQNIFGQGPDTIMAPIIMLLLLIISAAITGSLVLGKPILWYFDGKKKEAVALFAYTLCFLVLLAIGLIVFLSSMKA